MKILLVDNGSLEPAATLALRGVAARLAARVGHEVWPVSMLHSDKVAADDLDEIEAEIVAPFLRREAARGEREFVVVPLFLGPSRAITDYLPGVAATLRKEFPDLAVSVAPTLYEAGDGRLTRMLAEWVRATLPTISAEAARVRVALVDHGSPVRAVTEVRNAVAAQVAAELGQQVAEVQPCSMERRAGVDFNFNEPLLASVLARTDWQDCAVVIAQLFLVPGRHAGPDGDIAQICRRAAAAAPSMRISRTAVLSSHPLLIDLLADRLASVVAPRSTDRRA